MTKPLLSDLTQRNVVSRLGRLFEAIMADSYLGEPVTIGEHMVQCAACAVADGAPDELIAAALLHDVGYYVDARPDNENETEVSRRHDIAAGRVLAPFFPAAVVEPIRLHVEAKRYLCAVEPGYRDRLSEASKQTMRLQGGVMSADEVERFRANPYCEAACRLRRWDEASKELGADVPGFEAYRSLLVRLAGRCDRRPAG